MKLSPSLLGTLQKLPIFQDLSPTQLKGLFRICQQETYEPGVSLCRVGAESDRMYILLSGTVEVSTTSHVLIVHEKAVTTIGEAGVLTGEPRSASVVTETAVKALSIDRRSLQKMVRDDAVFGIRLYRNVMAMLRQKLIAADQRIEELSQAQEQDSDKEFPVMV